MLHLREREMFTGADAMPRTGRPKAGEGDLGTKQVRLYADLAEMIADLIEVEGGTTAALCDPLLRPQVAARWKQREAEIQVIRKAKEQLARAREQVARKKGK